MDQIDMEPISWISLRYRILLKRDGYENRGEIINDAIS